MDDDRDLADRFEQHRPRLRALAHRMLGSPADAEDAVQEVWLRLGRADGAGIDDLGGWLTTVTSRICLDRLRARRARRETGLDEVDPDRPGTEDPAADVVLADAVGRALVVVLDTLAPAERVALVLHDVFAMPFAEIAPILDRSPEATRKLAGRARRRARLGAEGDQHRLDERREVVARFLAAVRAGDVAGLLAVLAPDAVRRVDPALLAPGQPAVVRGARAIAASTRRFTAPAPDAEPAVVDGRPGAVVRRDGAVTLALVVTVTDGHVAGFEVVADPARLADLAIGA